MMKYYRHNGRVYAFELDGSQDAWIPEDAVLMTPEEVEAHTAPPPVDLYALAATLRWQKEIGGIEVGGVTITTDDRSKTLLQGARTAADANPDHIEGWKAATGWVDLTAAQIIAMSDAVRAHVSACFALERAVAGQIADGTITTPEQVQAAFA